MSHNPAEEQRLIREAVLEAQLILSRHEGIHLLHSDCQLLIFMREDIDQGEPMNRDKVKIVLERMRQVDRTGIYPIADS